VWPAARVGRANAPPWSWAARGGLRHWPGVPEQTTPVLTRPATAGSARSAPVALDGPLLVTTRVDVVGAPAVAAWVPSVLLIARSASGLPVSVAEASLFVRFGSVPPAGGATVAPLVTLPVVALTVALTLSP